MTERKVQAGTQAGGRGVLFSETRTLGKGMYVQKFAAYLCVRLTCAQKPSCASGLRLGEEGKEIYCVKNIYEKEGKVL